MSLRTGRDLGIIYLSYYIGVTTAVFFLPLLLQSRGISDLGIGYLAIPYSVALFTSNSTFGRLTDSYGRRKFLLLGLFCSSLTTASFIFVQGFVGFFIARLLNGITLGMFPAAIIAIASDRKKPMGELTAWRALGWTFGAIFNGIIAEILYLEAAFLLGSAVFMAAFVYAYLKDTGGRVDSMNQQQLHAARPQPQYGTVIRHNWQIYLTVILRHGSGASIWIYWTLFLEHDLGLNTAQIGIVLAINTITQTTVIHFFGDRGDSQRMLLAGTFLSALAFLSFPLAKDFLQICLTQLLLGVSFAFFLVGGLRSAEYRGGQLGMVGTATGLFEASFSISQLVGPLLAIVVISQFHTYTSLMYVAGAITLATTLLYAGLSWKKPLEISGTQVEA